MPFAAPAFLYAWSVIDSAHRLKGLVDNFPGFEKKRRVPEVRSFLKEAESVENLRHAVQHMEGSIRQSATPGHAVWGSLSWLVRGDEETVFTCLLTVGALMPGAAFQPINPAGITLKEEIDSVRLTLGETAVHLSELLEVISKVVGFIEAGLRKEFEGFPARAGSDYFIALRVKRNPDGSVTLLAAGDPPKA